MKNHAVRVALLALALTAGVGCDSSGTTLSQYMDGCRDKQGFLLHESLERSDGEPVTVGLIAFRPPPGSYIRVRTDSASIIQGVYCDSGDWGIDRGNHVRLKLYPHPPPVDLYSDVPEEVTFVLSRMAPPIGTVDYEFSVSGIEWRAKVELSGAVIPSIRTAYLTTTIGPQALAVSFVTEVGASTNLSALESVLRSIVVPQ